MASSLASHLCAFLFFFLIGIRRILSLFSFYLQNSPTQFRAKPWYLHSSRLTLFNNLDLYILLIALPIASFADLYLFLSILPHRFSFLHHQALLTCFWLLLLFILLTNHHPLPDAFLFLFAATAFLLDFYFIKNEGIAFTNLTSAAYHLSGVLSLLCAASCIYLAVNPFSFVAEFALSAGLVFKGTWDMQIGLSLYSEMFAFKGCRRMNEQVGDVKCDLNEDSLRGIALINLSFVCHAIGILLATFSMFAFLSYKSTALSDATGPLLIASELEASRQAEFEIKRLFAISHLANQVKPLYECNVTFSFLQQKKL